MIITTRQGRKRSIVTPDEIDSVAGDMVSTLTPEERALLFGILQDDENGVESTQELMDHRYHTEPVSMEQFIDDPYYLGESCETLYPELRKDLIDLFDYNYREVVLTGAIGVGKTFLLSISLCRVIYELSCLIDPQKTFGLSTGTEMVIPLISKNLPLARQVMKTAIDDKIRESPYFMEKFTPRISKEYTLFPSNIRVIIGSYGSERILGSNVFSVGLDECFGEDQSVSVVRDGEVSSVTVGDLWRMSDPEKSYVEVLGFDHEKKEVKSGWWRIKKSTIQRRVNIKTGHGDMSPSLEHPVLVRRGDWLVYDYACNIKPGDSIVTEGVSSTVEEEDGGKGDGSCELKFARGVRDETLRVDDLPVGLALTKVLSVRELPSEQTYSLCTQYETFFAGGFLVHNTNFPPARKAQQITTGFGQRRTRAHYDPVEKVYRNLVRRIKSRMMKAGGDFPGMIILASSAATLESFTERKIKDSRDDPKVFVRDHVPWTAKPGENFCGEKFWVICSSSSLRARILEEDEYDVITDEYLDDNDAWLLDVPIEYKDDFDSDIENALRDIAGISTQAMSIYIQRSEAIRECADPEIKHAFTMGEWTAGGPGAFRWKYLCRRFERRLPGGYTEEGFMPKVNPKALRWCHIDTSVSGDSTGFTVAHIDRWVEVVRRDGDGRKYVDYAPSFYVDVVLRINPPPGEQIYLPDLRRLVYELSTHGYSFMGFSTDKYQYVEMHQQIKRRGIHAELISMDETTNPYDELKRAIYEKRIRFHEYEPLIEELKTLEYDRLRGKIDHPEAGCFVGSTRIPLLDGSCPMISELAGKEVELYSCTQNGRIVPGIARGRLTKYVTDFVDIVLDSGAVERCTPEHFWMLRDGTYKRADMLRPGVDRLMPISRIWPVNGGYERVSDSHGRRTLTHHLVWSFHYDDISNDKCVHHLNGCKVDNALANLACESKSFHAYHHTLMRHRESGEYTKKVAEGLQRFNTSERGRRVHSEAMSRLHKSSTTEDYIRRAHKNRNFRSDIDLESLNSVRSEENANAAARSLNCGRNVVMRVLRENGFKNWEDFLASEIGKNHKVRYVIPVKLEVAVPVYDLEVDVFSNFALASGVFVHNSKDIADAVAGAIYGLSIRSTRLPIDMIPDKGIQGKGDNSWVSPLVPASQVDIAEAREMAEDAQDSDYVPILFGD